jgi:hypothetical protein
VSVTRKLGIGSGSSNLPIKRLRLVSSDGSDQKERGYSCHSETNDSEDTSDRTLILEERFGVCGSKHG